MLKLILDTNIIVSSFLKDGYPRYIVREHILKHKAELILSHEVLNEYSTVLLRPKFKKYGIESEVLALLHYFQNRFPLLNPIEKFNIITDDSDNKFIDLAFFSGADFLISGNTNDFHFGKLMNFEIITPKITGIYIQLFD
jgi:putative PIN family toxin of toxin-antitoxin system